MEIQQTQRQRVSLKNCVIIGIGTAWALFLSFPRMHPSMRAFARYSDAEDFEMRAARAFDTEPAASAER